MLHRALGISMAMLLVVEIGSAQHYQINKLTADQSGQAANTDANLVNAWGMARSSGGPWWISDNGTGLATLYDGTGAAQPLVVIIAPVPNSGVPATPTGQVFNGSGDFGLAPQKPAIFIFVTEDGTVSGWNPTIDLTHSILVRNDSPGSVYKGVALGRNASSFARLYVADFRKGRVLVLDTAFQPVTLGSGAFVDPQLPAGYAPFNVQNIGGDIYVSYAKQDEAKHDDVPGPGHGYVSVFTQDGTLVQRLEHGPWFNSPWAMTVAPSDFGFFSRDLLVGQFGSGEVAVFDPATGKFKGKLLGPSGSSSLKIDGLWGLSFGNNGKAGSSTTLFFTAGPNHEQNGLFGSVLPIAKELIQGNTQ